MTFLFAEPKEWWLEISSPQQAEFWQQSQQHTTSNSCWNAYINRICLYTVFDLIKDNTPEASIWLGADKMPAVWDVVNGSAITIGTTKLVIIPTEAIDDGELEVPQEWVDIPSWVGDYYIVVQFRTDGNCLRVWGYTTHQELKNNSEYDPDDRTYCMDALDLMRDMNALWVRRQCYPEASTRTDVPLLPPLPATQAENLIKRLGDAAVVFPRFSLPFATWGALLENEQWRQNLYATRQGSDIVPPLTRLSEWLLGKFDDIWQIIEDTNQFAIGWRGQNTQITTQNPIFTTNRAKVLNFSSSNEQLALLIGILPINDIEVTIGVEIRPIDSVVYLPNDVQVRLLDENGNELAKANAGVTQTIQFQFGGEQHERFSIEVTCGSKVITEHFVI